MAAIFVWRHYTWGTCVCPDGYYNTVTTPSVESWVQYGLYVWLYDCGHGEAECDDWTPPGASETLDCGELSPFVDTPFYEEVYGQGNEICDACPGVVTGECAFYAPDCLMQRLSTCTCDGEDCWMEVRYAYECGEVVEGPPDP